VVEDDDDEDEDNDGITLPPTRSIVAGTSPQAPLQSIQPRIVQAPQQPATKKRKSSRHVVCGRCEEVFDAEAERQPKACQFHSGSLEADYEMFEDHDEECHGAIDSREMQDEFPENYIWSCCDGTGDTEGCTMGMHVEKGGRKRTRY